jgi:hypothetical protein
MSILILIQACFLIGCFSFIWFNTDFLAFYLKLFKGLIPENIYNWLLVDEFFSRPLDEYTYEYIEYIYVKKYFSDNFTTTFILKILSCTICLGVWLSVITSLILGSILWSGIIFFLSKLVEFSLKFFLKMH